MNNFHKKPFLILIDIAAVNAALFGAYLIRFDGNIQSQYIAQYIDTFLIVTILHIITFYAFRLYNRIWSHASINELLSIVASVTVAVLAVMGYTMMVRNLYPRSIYIILWLLNIAFIGGIRFSVRSLKNNPIKKKNNGGSRVLIVGAGDAGAIVINEFKKHAELKCNPVALVDDDKSKLNMRIHGVPVLGSRHDIPVIVKKKKIKEIIIAMPSVNRKDIREIVEICRDTGCKLKTLPGVFELIDGKVNVSQIREVDIQDLLGREPVKVNLDEISAYIRDKVVLVTGGGGSIGSELCRQIAQFDPKELLILDINENSLYDMEYEISNKFPGLKFRTIIASVRDIKRVEGIMDSFKPHAVFHAAAHKHVPMMENNPEEAVKNNVFGTLNMAEAANKYKVDKFVLVSTDKAVNPSNIMGATKRIAEMIIQSIDKKSSTDFVAVRFGNVLGSRGSVIPLFKSQIARGGPVTVTHPEVKRYFMTIPEAVQLVIQAGSMAKGGEIFILDMGEPVKIVNLAKDLIRLSGLEPEKDIEIDYIGLRPGDKLFEELVMDNEGVKRTWHEKIYVAKPTFSDIEKLKKEFNILKTSVDKPGEDIVSYVQKLVPFYTQGDGSSVSSVLEETAASD